MAKRSGVLERQRHTEATVDLMSLAGLNPAGVLCELTNDDGTMSRLPDIEPFAEKHSLPLLTVKDIVAYRRELAVEKALEVKGRYFQGTIKL